MASKEREQQFLEGFRRCCTSFPDGEIESCEPPDFLVRGVDRVTGIEVTEFLIQADPGEREMKEQESLRRQVVDAAKNLAGGRGLPELQAGIHFNHRTRLAKRDVQALAERLVSLIAVNLPSENQTTEIDGNTYDGEDFPEDHVSAVMLLATPGMHAHWHSSEGGFMAVLGPKEFQDRIDQKGAKVSEYRKRCDRIWLIVVCDGWSPSSLIDADSTVSSHVFRSRFDATFLYFHAERRMIEFRQA
jgi:hypothetical protein